VGQSLRLGCERLVFAGLGRGPLDLLHHVTQIVGFALDVFPAGLQLCSAPLELAQPLVRIPYGDARDVRIAVGVKDVALRVRLEQRLCLVLSVQVDKQRAELREYAHGGGAAVDPGAGPPLPRDLTLQHQAPVFDFHSEGG